MPTALPACPQFLPDFVLQGVSLETSSKKTRPKEYVGEVASKAFREGLYRMSRAKHLQHKSLADFPRPPAVLPVCPQFLPDFVLQGVSHETSSKKTPPKEYVEEDASKAFREGFYKMSNPWLT